MMVVLKMGIARIALRRWLSSGVMEKGAAAVVKEGRKCSGESCSSNGAAAPAFQFDGAAVTVICLVRKRRKWRLLQAAVATGIWRSELLYWDEDDVAAVVDGFYALDELAVLDARGIVSGILETFLCGWLRELVDDGLAHLLMVN
ncbi:hypothetical protein F0562_010444 [Nyssa sinensis]|uniref:Uncharacterized protein n=1 Tax=Nyssa sinensis TaxID=561372 RepID=A0A5J4ZZ44_9ASTE|nr:hypothetical protein F0562_010444 [Nyssa sinensis]